MKVLEVDVSAGLLERWRGWFAPEVQPFRTTTLAGRLAAEVPTQRNHEPSDEVRDTFFLYAGVPIWLTESEFVGLSIQVRRALLAGREATGRARQLSDSVVAQVGWARTDSRIVWWPSLLHKVGDEPLIFHVEEGVAPSRHREVTDATWAAARRVLPGAARLAGTFPDASGPNCFGTVMAAAGVEGAETRWMVQEPFETWLAQRSTPMEGTAQDHLPGVVLVWRDTTNLAVHAAVTVGGQYCLSKPSQAWCSPRLVWTVRETIDANRRRGQTLSRYLINPDFGERTDATPTPADQVSWPSVG